LHENEVQKSGKEYLCLNNYSENEYLACAFLSNLVILVGGLGPSAGTHGPRLIKKNKYANSVY